VHPLVGKLELAQEVERPAELDDRVVGLACEQRDLAERVRERGERLAVGRCGRHVRERGRARPRVALIAACGEEGDRPAQRHRRVVQVLGAPAATHNLAVALRGRRLGAFQLLEPGEADEAVELEPQAMVSLRVRQALDEEPARSPGPAARRAEDPEGRGRCRQHAWRALRGGDDAALQLLGLAPASRLPEDVGETDKADLRGLGRRVGQAEVVRLAVEALRAAEVGRVLEYGGEPQVQLGRRLGKALGERDR
jgi:hypothetical protein